jgi:hypothetical protein
VTSGWWLLAVTAMAVLAVVLFRAYWYPLQRCPRCKDRVSGSGWGSTSKAFNLRCRACGDKGRRVRPLTRFLHKTVGMPVREKRDK